MDKEDFNMFEAKVQEKLPQKVYAIVRKDLDTADAIVQVGHSLIEGSKKFTYEEGHYLIVLQVANELALVRTLRKLNDAEINFFVFYEPDGEMGQTAIATEGFEGGHEFFKNYRLWRP